MYKMKCPDCGHTDHSEIDLNSDGFSETLCECACCGCLWSVGHNLIPMIVKHGK